MTPKLTLISHKLCPYVQRAVIALNEKGVPFERIDIDLANKPDWFLKISPLGKVPVLRVATDDGEVALFESNVICEYIEETQGGAKLHPQDPLQRAQHRAWMEFGSTILSDYGAWRPPAIPRSSRASGRRSPRNSRGSRRRWARARSLPAKDFSLVDAVFAPIFRYFDVFDQLIDLSVFADTPKLRAWRTRTGEAAERAHGGRRRLSAIAARVPGAS